MEIVFKTPAALDVNEIFVWYENQIVGLGDDFLEDLDAVIFHILSYPASFRFRYKKFRAVKLARFPYLIYYNIEKEK
jgi:hypothetical protein